MIWRRAVGAVAAISVALGLMFAAPPPPAEASVPPFDPAYIISDYAFWNSRAMTEAEIQAFLLERVGGVCSNSLCLPMYRESTPSRDFSRCEPYSGASSESAARILFKVQEACGLSAKVLLVTLHKEQGLVTSRSPTASQNRIAI